MKRAATSERGGKASKRVTSNTKLITLGIDLEGSEMPKTPKRRKKRLTRIPMPGEKVFVPWLGAKPFGHDHELYPLRNLGGKGISGTYIETIMASIESPRGKQEYERAVIEVLGKKYLVSLRKLKPGT